MDPEYIYMSWSAGLAHRYNELTINYDDKIVELGYENSSLFINSDLSGCLLDKKTTRYSQGDLRPQKLSYESSEISFKFIISRKSCTYCDHNKQDGCEDKSENMFFQHLFELKDIDGNKKGYTSSGFRFDIGYFQPDLSTENYVVWFGIKDEKTFTSSGIFMTSHSKEKGTIGIIKQNPTAQGIDDFDDKFLATGIKWPLKIEESEFRLGFPNFLDDNDESRYFIQDMVIKPDNNLCTDYARLSCHYIMLRIIVRKLEGSDDSSTYDENFGGTRELYIFKDGSWTIIDLQRIASNSRIYNGYLSLENDIPYFKTIGYVISTNTRYGMTVAKNYDTPFSHNHSNTKL